MNQGAIGAYVASKIFSDKEEEKPKSTTTSQIEENKTPTLLGENEHLLCPISQSIMTDPVAIKQCGHTFQRKEITRWLEKQQFCPLCKTHAGVEDLVQNYIVKSLVDDAIRSEQLKN